MKSLIDDLSPRLKKWVEIDEDAIGLYQSDMYEWSAQEAAARLVWLWDSQFSGLDAETVITDIDRTVYHMQRWRDELVQRIKTHPEEF